jgi:serine protease AprX
MRTSLVDEALQIKQPCQNSAMWGSRLPRPATTWRTHLPLGGNSRNNTGELNRNPITNKWFLGLLVCCAMLFFSSSTALAHPKIAPSIDVTQKVSPELRAYLIAAPARQVDVVIQLNNLGSFKLKHVLVKGGKLRRRMKNVQVVAITLPAADIASVARMEEVRYISLDRPVRMSLDRAVKAVAADIGWSYGLKGKGVSIAIIDSGVFNHPDLNELGFTKSRVVYSESFILGESRTEDAYGHGTHVAGILAGNGQSSAAYQSQYRGAAPEANIVNLRVLDANGQGTDSAVIAAIDRAIELKGKYNIRVINLSLGRSVYEHYTMDPLCQAVEAAWKAGIVVVVAAGNSGRDNSLGLHGYGTIAAPANDPYVITVGATDMNNTPERSDDAIASYSSKGPTLLDHIVKPDLVAPGNRVVSLLDPIGTLPTNYSRLKICDTPNGSCGNAPAQYFRLSGTSMAAPMVAGAAALMLQQDPNLTPDLVKARMMKTAWKGFAAFSTAKDYEGRSYKHQADIFTYGAGYLDVQAALNSTDTGEGAALSPIAIYNSTTGMVSLNFGPSASSVIWGSSGPSADSVIWGSSDPSATSVIWGSSEIWGTSVIWGATISDASTNTLWGNSVVWGSSLETGFSVIWGSSVIWGASMNTAFSPGDEGDCAADDLSCTLDATASTDSNLLP